MHSPGINGEGELRGQPANPGSPGKMAVKTECVCVCVDDPSATIYPGCPGNWQLKQVMIFSIDYCKLVSVPTGHPMNDPSRHVDAISVNDNVSTEGIISTTVYRAKFGSHASV